MDDQPTHNIDPGPKEWGVLNEEVQQSHRSQLVWNTGDCHCLRVRRASHGSLGEIEDPNMIPVELQQHLMRVGCWHVARMKRLPVGGKLFM